MITKGSIIFFLIILNTINSFAITNDIAKICQDTTNLDAVNIQDKKAWTGCSGMDEHWGRVVTNGSSLDIFSYIQKTCNLHQLRTFNPMTWLLLASPRIEARLVAHQLQLSSVDEFMFQHHQPQTINYLNVLSESAKNPAKYSPEVAAKVNEELTDPGNQNLLNALLDKAKAYTSVICLPFSTFGCSSALRDAMALSHVEKVGIGQVSMSEQVKHVFIDERFNQGLALMTLEILNDIKAAQAGFPPTTHLFNNLIKNFKLTGLNEKTAIEFTFDFMALYGTRGAEMDSIWSLSTIENESTMLAAFIISSGIGILDGYTLASGHPYSLPAEITTHCAYGSPYHFWMPAAISWALVNRGHNFKSSLMAPHIMGVGYEMFSETLFRTPWMPLARESKSLENNMTRIEIAMNDAGARYGAEMGKQFKISHRNIDERIDNLLKSASDLPPLSAEEAVALYSSNKLGYLFRWWEIFKPSAGLNSASRQANLLEVSDEINEQ